jgi:hypothetical protein
MDGTLSIKFGLLAFLFTMTCGCMASKLPLSDETSSTPDARLIGKWKLVMTSDEPPKEREVRIDRKASAEKLLEASFASDDHETKVDLLLTKIAGRDFVSFKYAALQPSAKNDFGEKYPFCIASYEFLTKTKIQFRPFELPFVVAAIQRGEIGGDKTPYKILVATALDDQPAKMREFIERNAEQCLTKEPIFLGKHSITMTKVDESPGDAAK